jgi:hypothetical protein
MPFTYLSEPTARILKSLVGPICLIQPSKTHIPDNITVLASLDLVEVRTPLTEDDARLQAALEEFKTWALANPGRSTAGAGFIGSRQGEIPFYEETAINRIRTDLKRYASTDDSPSESQTGFSERLFLAVAQENDQASDRLDHDLHQYKALEKAFLETLQDDHATSFNRQPTSGTVWRDDPGAKLTTQRIRAWARLALADTPPAPDLLITTSAAVMDTLTDSCGEGIGFEKAGALRMAIPNEDEAPALSTVLTDLIRRQRPSPETLSALSSLAVDAESESCVMVTFYVAEDRSIEAVIRYLAAETGDPVEMETIPGHDGHALIVLVEC